MPEDFRRKNLLTTLERMLGGEGPEQLPGAAVENAIILDALPDIVYVLDLEGRLRRWNRRLEEVTGYRLEQLRNQPAVNVIHPADHQAHFEALRRKIETGYDETDLRLVTQDGRTFLYHWIGVLLTNADGQPIGVCGVGRDITEQRRMEEALRLQNEQLQTLDALKSTFVNAVGHELRTPLTSIRGFVEFLEDEVEGPLTPGQRSFVAQIDLGTQRLIRLVDDLVDLARLEAGQFDLATHPTDLTGIAANVLKSLQPQAQAKGVRLIADLPPGPLETCADAQRLEQVLINLLHNAIKFASPDGMVRLTLGVSGREARFQVEDDGPGVPLEYRERLFEKFFQVPERQAEARGGVGLGLFIAHALVAAHGGMIGVEGREGPGARFWFTVPIRPC
ncbi:MAG: ATP-binding protein [Candidatus Sericytochromatia bacterium]